MAAFGVGFEVVDMSEKSELDVARNASEASNQLRGSPSSSNKLFGPFGIVIESATRLELWWRLTVVCCCCYRGRKETRLQRELRMVGCISMRASAASSRFWLESVPVLNPFLS